MWSGRLGVDAATGNKPRGGEDDDWRTRPEKKQQPEHVVGSVVDDDGDEVIIEEVDEETEVLAPKGGSAEKALPSGGADDKANHPPADITTSWTTTREDRNAIATAIAGTENRRREKSVNHSLVSPTNLMIIKNEAHIKEPDPDDRQPAPSAKRRVRFHPAALGTPTRGDPVTRGY